VDVRYFYQTDKRNYQQEAIIDKFANAISKIIELPPLLEVCLYPLDENVYGGIDMLRINRIGINSTLPFDAIPKILAHELIHVHQKHKGFLKIKSDGTCYWHGIPITKKLPEDMTYEEYSNLPWELDVTNKQMKVLSEAINLLTNNPNSDIL
jgi:hypothetical protein